MRRLFDFTHGLLALAATITILAGPPIFLTAYTEDRIGALRDVFSDELASDSARVEIYLTSGLLLIFWLAWLMMAVSILTEAFALARGSVARRLPFFPGIQEAAGRLVASCALVVSSFGSAAPTAAAPILPLAPPPASASVLVVDGELDTLLTSDAAITLAADTDAAGGPRYETQQGDTWWSLAERFLDDGLRWGEILDANDGATMADGITINSATASPRPGWQIELPSDAVLPLELRAAAPAAPSEAVAQPHAELDAAEDAAGGDESPADVEVWNVTADEHFWGIAEQTLTDSWGRTPTDAEIHPYWVELVDANEGRLLPPEDPDMIYPDQIVIVPDPPPNPDTTNSAGTDDDAAAADDQLPLSTEQPNDEPGPSPDDTETGVASDNGADDPPESPDEGTVPQIEVPSAELQPPPTTVPGNNSPVESTDTNDGAAAGTPGTMPSTIPVPQQPQYPADPVAPDDTPPPTVAIDPLDQDGGDDFEISLLSIAVVVTGLGLAAAGLLSVINRLRTRRVGERRPGLAPKFKPPAGLEAELQRSADPDGLADINRAMRFLGTRLADRDSFLSIVGVSLEADRLHVLLDGEDHDAPEPFESQAHWWSVDRRADLPDPAPDAVAPLPALVTIGHTSRSQLLVDLEFAGVLNLTGTRGEVLATMTTMATELAASPLADQLDIVCVGFGHDLDVFERVTVLDDLDELSTRLRSHVGDLNDIVDGAAQLSGATGRVKGIGGDVWTPLIVFAPDAATESELLELARTNVGAGVTALVTVDGTATWQVHVKGNRIEIPHLGLAVDRANFTPEQVANTRRLIEDARDPESVGVVDLVEAISDREPEPQTQDLDTDANSTPDDGDDLWDRQAPASDNGGALDDAVSATPRPVRPTWADVDYWVQVLGPVRVVDRSGNEVAFVRTATPQLLAYLIQHRNGVTVEGATEAIFPNQAPNKKRMYNLAYDARKQLGESPDGSPYVPKAVDGMLHISDWVGSDFEQFADLVVYAGQCGHQEALVALREALELVRGEPFTGRGLDWATISGASTDVAVTVDEAARTMATIALDHLDQPEDAAWATQQGLAVVPHSSELHLLRLRAALARENGGVEPDAVFQHYVAVMEADDDLPEGGNSLDGRIVELYESYRRSSPRRWAAEAPAS